MRSSDSFPASGRYFVATSHRIAAKPSQVIPSFSPPLFACNSPISSATADCTEAEIVFVALIQIEVGNGQLPLMLLIPQMRVTRILPARFCFLCVLPPSRVERRRRNRAPGTLHPVAAPYQPAKREENYASEIICHSDCSVGCGGNVLPEF